jgi:ArsR family transcriptional regulator
MCFTGVMTTTLSSTASRRAALFALLGDPLRLRIVELLATEELCTCHLIEETGAKQTTISNHLRILREAGAVTSQVDGRFTWYRLSQNLLDSMSEHLTDLAQSAAQVRRNRQPCS